MKRGLGLALVLSLGLGVMTTAPAIAQQTPEEACRSVQGITRAICIESKRRELEAQKPAGPVELAITGGVPQRLTTSNTPYEPEIRITGANLNNVEEIRWTWSGVRSGSGSWRPGDSNWDRFKPARDGRSAVIKPRLLGTGEKLGVYNWSFTLVAGGREQTRSFEVRYDVLQLTVNTLPRRLEANSAPWEYDFQLSGAGLDQVTELRWTWRGPRNGQSTWRPNNGNWSRFTPSRDGRTARLRPVLLEQNDATGLYSWTITFVTPSGEVTRNFEINYTRRDDNWNNGNGNGNGYGGGNGNGYGVGNNGNNYNSGGNIGGYDLEAPRQVYPGATSSPGPVVQRNQVRLEWDQVQGAEYYELSVRDMVSGKTVIDQEVRGASFNANLDGYRSYRWTVAACNRRGCSGTTRPAYFRTP